MLDDLGGVDDIEECAAFGKVLGGDAAIVDLETGLRRVLAGSLYGLRGGVDSGDKAAKPRHRFRQQAAAAADIKDAQPGKAAVVSASADAADAVENVVDPHRREVVERCHRPVRIPPAR